MNTRMTSFWVLLLVAAGCEGGGDGVTRQPEPVDPTCDSTSVLENGTCRVFAERIDARATTSFVENGEAVELEVVLFKPLEGERFPLLVVNHGSTGNGSDPSLFGNTFVHKPTTLHFVEQGWMVAYPQRRGRGNPRAMRHRACERNQLAISTTTVLPPSDEASLAVPGSCGLPPSAAHTMPRHAREAASGPHPTPANSASLGPTDARSVGAGRDSGRLCSAETLAPPTRGRWD